ncbi:DUF6252 family protein [Flavobacterium sp. MC2016-06]|uniref:DUF6252 family protein n=1 Tax=Flavobacterium sp. MC2016-06 TaxID=2676308 RepID=UPI0012BA9F6B|nr:DUF6252 family protein [Flavobacterium sp. MC2016-06]MBU3859403.1 hypothetical protein [Flavobacterium sp. MC2016-06]
MKRFLTIGLLSLLVVFTSCSSDDNDDNGGSGSVTATINGAEWKATKITSVTLIKVPGEDGGQRFDINVQNDSQMLLLACESELTTNDAMPLKEYTFEDQDDDTDTPIVTTSNALFLNYYLVDGNSYGEHFPKSGKITITAMDPQKKTVSGTFSFTAEKVGTLQTKIVTPNVFELTKGVFKNLPYTVIKAQ